MCDFSRPLTQLDLQLKMKDAVKIHKPDRRRIVKLIEFDVACESKMRTVALVNNKSRIH